MRFTLFVLLHSLLRAQEFPVLQRIKRSGSACESPEFRDLAEHLDAIGQPKRSRFWKLTGNNRENQVRDRVAADCVTLYMLGSAPDLDVAFKDERDRDAARRFMDLLDQANAADAG